MEDEPRERTEDRRRRGPLGDEGDAGETRRVPQEGESKSRGSEETRQDTRSDAPETRVIRTPGASTDQPATPYPRGYLEALDQREAHLREVHGGVDWLASFIGCVFALLCSAVLLALAGLVLTPLGFTLNLAGREIGPAIITGLVAIGVALFLAYFFGGYVAGRLARFDGGRNGAMTVAWSIVLALIAAAAGIFLPGLLFEFWQSFLRDSALPALGGLTELGFAGAGILVGALLLELLGGFLGGRLGVRYHTLINRTT